MALLIDITFCRSITSDISVANKKYHNAIDDERLQTMKVHVTNCSSFLWWMGHSNKLIEIIFWAVTPVSYIVGQKMAIYEWKFIITSNSIESADFFLSIEINEAVCQHKKLSS